MSQRHIQDTKNHTFFSAIYLKYKKEVITMENKILNEIELKNIIGGKNTHSTDVFKSKGDMGKCLLSFFRNCD